MLVVVHNGSAAGLGKTTISHVVARHCGYRPFEINASDDRTATALQSRIQDAVQMQSVLGKRQMNLVIVDEVDGIAGAVASVSSYTQVAFACYITHKSSVCSMLGVLQFKTDVCLAACLDTDIPFL